MKICSFFLVLREKMVMSTQFLPKVINDFYVKYKQNCPSVMPVKQGITFGNNSLHEILTSSNVIESTWRAKLVKQLSLSPGDDI